MRGMNLQTNQCLFRARLGSNLLTHGGIRHQDDDGAAGSFEQAAQSSGSLAIISFSQLIRGFLANFYATCRRNRCGKRVEW
jgi:hypothetical protein